MVKHYSIWLVLAIVALKDLEKIQLEIKMLSFTESWKKNSTCNNPRATSFQVKKTGSVAS